MKSAVLSALGILVLGLVFGLGRASSSVSAASSGVEQSTPATSSSVDSTQVTVTSTEVDINAQHATPEQVRANGERLRAYLLRKKTGEETPVANPVPENERAAVQLAILKGLPLSDHGAGLLGLWNCLEANCTIEITEDGTWFESTPFSSKRSKWSESNGKVTVRDPLGREAKFTYTVKRNILTIDRTFPEVDRIHFQRIN